MTIETLLSILPAVHILVGAACVLHILASKKRASPTILWILAVIYLPWVGVLAYLAFGVNTVKRRLEKREHRLRRLPASLHQLSGPVEDALDESKHPDIGATWTPAFKEFFKLLGNLAGVDAVGGNRCCLMRGGEQVFAEMERSVAEATSSVHLMTYIVEDDEVGRALFDGLAEKARAGVRVRVLVDGYGSNMFALRRVRRYRRAGVDLRLLRQFDPVRGRFAINLRNHRKIMICDGAVAFIGGMNISARHLLESDRKRPVLDYHTKIEGPVVAQLQAVFGEDWFDATSESIADPLYFPEIEPVGTDIVRTISGGPDHRRHLLLKAFCAALQTAGTSIKVVTPYFVPDPAVTMLLSLAALGGVDTSIVVPSANNHPEIKYASRYRYADLMRSGVKIFERTRPFSHAKLFVIDDSWASVGSANWDMRTFHLQFDTNVGVVSPRFVAQIVAAVDEEIAASTFVEPSRFLPRPRVRGALERAASLFEDLL